MGTTFESHVCPQINRNYRLQMRQQQSGFTRTLWEKESKNQGHFIKPPNVLYVPESVTYARFFPEGLNKKVSLWKMSLADKKD